jgi:hypothetical protein
MQVIHYYDNNNKRIRVPALLNGEIPVTHYEWEIGIDEVMNVSEAVSKGVKFFPDGLRDTIHKILLSG